MNPSFENAFNAPHSKFDSAMGYRLRPSDCCPRCGEQLTHHTRSIWTLFLRDSYLGCSRCGLTAHRRSRHRAPLERRYAAHDGIFKGRIDIEPLPNRKFQVFGIVIAGFLLAALIYSRDDIVSFAARTFEQATEEGLAQKVVDALLPPRIDQERHVAAPELLVSRPFEVVVEEPVSLRAVSPPPLPLIAVTPAVSLRPDLPLPVIAVTRPVSLRADLTPEAVRQALIAAAVPVQGGQAQLPPGRRYGLQHRNSRITLRMHSPTIVAIRDARNRVFIDRKLAPGDTYRVPNLVGLWLTAIDASAVEIVLDGTSVGFAGAERATVWDLSLDPQSIANLARRTSPQAG